MQGVVYANAASGTANSLSKYSPNYTLASGVVPPGIWMLSVAATLAIPGGGTETIPIGGLVNSDGVSVTTAGGTGVLLGPRPMPVWPWPATFPH